MTVNDALKIGTVLTIPAAGSEGSGDSVITKTDGMLKWDTSGEALLSNIFNNESRTNYDPTTISDSLWNN